MTKKINIGDKGKVEIVWNTTQSSFTKEQEQSIITLMAKKYEIPAKNIRVTPNYIVSNADGVLLSENVENIHDPKFMQELMKKYIADNNIKDVDFEEIIKIDSQINSLIDFDSYEKSKRYTIKWVKWSNFLSYGPDNFFDFTTLHGLVLLNGEPANKSGKSTFAYDLLHFLLFGKTNTNKAKTLGDLFNNYLPDAKTVNVEGCINIDGEDYIIRRTLTRPSSGKKTKTITNKVEYYKVLADGTEEILKDENLQGSTSAETTKIIKEALGNESDFDLIISANAKDLDSLISLTETEKGRLLSRWIGLSIIEDKDAIARNKWNKEISVGRFSDMYNKAQLESDIESLKDINKSYEKEIESSNKTIVSCDEKIAAYNESRDLLLLSKQKIDESLIKADVHTIESRMSTITENGKRKKGELDLINSEISNMGDCEYSDEEYSKLRAKSDSLLEEMSTLRAEINTLKNANTALSKAEYCPTCHRKFDNVDNSAQIQKNNEDIDSKTKSGLTKKNQRDEILKRIEVIDTIRTTAKKKSQLQLKASAINVEISNLRTEYTEKKAILSEIQKNREAIEKNSLIDAQLNVVNTNIRTEEGVKRDMNSNINLANREIARNNETIALKKSYLLKIDEERKVEKYWKLYLQMIGKAGISKMVLRNTLPIINSELNRLLGDVTDFEVEITMNDKNDIDFLLKRDGVITRLSAASGLEKTQAALALRVVLGKMSRLSRPPFILLDEVLGTVAKENYDDMKRLYDKIVDYYDFVLHICHIDLDWYDGKIITVQKVNNISSIKG